MRVSASEAVPTKSPMSRVLDTVNRLGLKSLYVREHQRLFVFLPLVDLEQTEVFCLTVLADYWVVIQSWPGPFKNFSDPQPGHEALLRLNDETRVAKFFLDEEGFPRLGADLRIDDLSPDGLRDILFMMVHTLKEVLPDAVAQPSRR